MREVAQRRLREVGFLIVGLSDGCRTLRAGAPRTGILGVA